MTECRKDCQGLVELRDELESCSAEKDAQINSLAHQLGGVRGDLLRIDGELKTLTKSVEDISQSLHIIATNTTQFMEVAQMYQNFKGFGFVVKNGGTVLVTLAAVIAALVYLAGVSIHIGG